MYNTDGKLVKQLTSGEWDVMQVIGMDAKERTLYYTSTQESPMQRHLYAVDLKSQKVTKLTAEHGTHNTLVNIEKGYFLDVFSSTDRITSYNVCYTKLLRNTLRFLSKSQILN